MPYAWKELADEVREYSKGMRSDDLDHLAAVCGGTFGGEMGSIVLLTAMLRTDRVVLKAMIADHRISLSRSMMAYVVFNMQNKEDMGKAVFKLRQLMKVPAPV